MSRGTQWARIIRHVERFFLKRASAKYLVLTTSFSSFHVTIVLSCCLPPGYRRKEGGGVGVHFDLVPSGGWGG